MINDSSIMVPETLNEDCFIIYEIFIYTQMPMRAGPYIMGIYLAYCHLYKKDLQKSYPLYYFCLLALVFIVYVGSLPPVSQMVLPALANFFWTCCSRQLFGLCLCYPLYFFLRDGNGLLAHKFWLPIANLSYSIYLINFPMFTLVSRLTYKMSDEEKEIGLFKMETFKDPECPVTTN